MGKIIITGPGRSGTTFLIQLLTRLGMDTGFSPESETYLTGIRAGCEWPIEINVGEETNDEIRANIEAAPRVLKSPNWSLALKYLLLNDLIDVEHVFVPIRDLNVAARSRLDVGLDWMVLDSLEGDERVQDQANILAMVLGRVIEACFLWEVPCTMLHFPTIVTDPGYCHSKLAPVLGADITEQEFITAWTALARPSQIVTK